MSLSKLTQFYGIIAGILAVCIHFIASIFPYSLIDILYTSGLYTVLKWILWPLQQLPFPSIYAIVLFFLLVAFFYVRFNYLVDKSVSKGIVRIFNVFGWLVFFFYLLWGFNYRSIPLKERLQLPDVQPDTTAFLNLYEDISRELIATRLQIKQDSIATLPFELDELAQHIADLEKEWLEQAALPVHIPAKVKPLPGGSLLRISTAGFYFPLGGEGYYDDGLHTITIPFVMAHELAHNYGITDEGEANFAAYRTCMMSDNPYIRYSALLDLWRYLAVTYRGIDEERYLQARDTMPNMIMQDLKAIRDQHQKFPDLFPDMRDWIYESYLQTQGVASGMKSYAQIIQLEMAYRRKYPSKN